MYILVYLLQEVYSIAGFWVLWCISHRGTDATPIVNCVNEGVDLLVDFSGGVQLDWLVYFLVA